MVGLQWEFFSCFCKNMEQWLESKLMLPSFRLKTLSIDILPVSHNYFLSASFSYYPEISNYVSSSRLLFFPGTTWSALDIKILFFQNFRHETRTMSSLGADKSTQHYQDWALEGKRVGFIPK